MYGRSMAARVPSQGKDFKSTVHLAADPSLERQYALHLSHGRESVLAQKFVRRHLLNFGQPLRVRSLIMEEM